MFIYFGVCVCVNNTHVEIKRQFAWVSFNPRSKWDARIKSSHRAWQQMPLSVEPCHWPLVPLLNMVEEDLVNMKNQRCVTDSSRLTRAHLFHSHPAEETLYHTHTVSSFDEHTSCQHPLSSHPWQMEMTGKKGNNRYPRPAFPHFLMGGGGGNRCMCPCVHTSGGQRKSQVSSTYSEMVFLQLGKARWLLSPRSSVSISLVILWDYKDPLPCPASL